MNLQNIFEHLQHGDLSQLAIAGDRFSDCGIEDKHKPQLIQHIQLALLALYKRFRLKEGEETIDIVSNQAVYSLTGDVLKIESCFDNNNVELKLDRKYDPHTIRVMSGAAFSVPEALRIGDSMIDAITSIRVVYRAKHPVIDMSTGIYSTSSVNIELPETHLQALLYYVASRIMNPVGMVNEHHSGNSYYAKYEGECQRLEQENMDLDNIGEECKFQERGFV